MEMNAIEIDDIDEELPFELMEHVKAAVLDLLPKKSREKYIKIYKNFKDWQNGYGVTTMSSNLLLAYFHVLSDELKYKPTSLWAFHSMLKATFRTYENIDFTSYTQVTAFLKTKSSGFKSKKAEVFTEEGMRKFIYKAEDLAWIDVKVACIFGICGAVRTEEFLRFTPDDIEKHGNLFLVKVGQTKTKISRSFTISGGFAGIVQKYMDLRPKALQSSQRFFTNYQKGKCTMQFMGKNKFSKMPQRIAEFLQLPEPKLYTGHSFRRTSATILANNGADIETIMRHGGWRHEACARGYIEDSLGYKKRTGDIIQCSITGPHTMVSSDAPGSVEKVTSSRNEEIPISLNTATVEFSFDSSIDDEVLVDLADHASQKVEPTFDSSISDDVLFDIVDQASQSFADDIVMAEQEKKKYARVTSSSILTKSINKNSTLNAMSSSSFKGVNFEKMENSYFNFYLGNGPNN